MFFVVVPVVSGTKSNYVASFDVPVVTAGLIKPEPVLVCILSKCTFLRLWTKINSLTVLCSRFYVKILFESLPQH
jgi:hypothetical protein